MPLKAIIEEYSAKREKAREAIHEFIIVNEEELTLLRDNIRELNDVLEEVINYKNKDVRLKKRAKELEKIIKRTSKVILKRFKSENIEEVDYFIYKHWESREEVNRVIEYKHDQMVEKHKKIKNRLDIILLWSYISPFAFVFMASVALPLLAPAFVGGYAGYVYGGRYMSKKLKKKFEKAERKQKILSLLLCESYNDIHLEFEL